METEENLPNEVVKKKIDWKRLAIVIALVVLSAGTTFLATWYVLDKSTKEQNEASDRVRADLQKQINDLSAKLKANSTANTATSTSTNTISTQAATTLTNDQIFAEVSSAFSFAKNQVVYFRIFGQDKVQYSLANPGGPGSMGAYAYKTSGKWNKIQLNQGVDDCSVYSSIPDQYRPICTQGTTSTLYYASSEGTSLNYPITSTTVHYIGN